MACATVTHLLYPLLSMGSPLAENNPGKQVFQITTRKKAPPKISKLGNTKRVGAIG
jgi:hypothetical protein